MLRTYHLPHQSQPNRNMPSKFLNDAQLSEMIAEFEKRNSENTNPSLTEMASWAKTNFKLEKLPHISTISRILKKNGGLARNRGRQFKYPEMEKELVNWIQKMDAENTWVSNKMIRRKANLLLREKNTSNTESLSNQLRLSNGWLYKFKTRHKLKISSARPVKRSGQMKKETQIV